MCKRAEITARKLAARAGVEAAHAGSVRLVAARKIAARARKTELQRRRRAREAAIKAFIRKPAARAGVEAAHAGSVRLVADLLGTRPRGFRRTIRTADCRSEQSAERVKHYFRLYHHPYTHLRPRTYQSAVV